MRDFSATPVPEVFTLHDLVHRLTLRTQADGSDRNKALMTRAIQDAIRALPGKHEWKYFTRQARFTTTPRITPEVTYDHTGGAVERLLTITDGTNIWPDDAGLGEVWIDDIERPFRVLRRLSSTEVQMEEAFSFTADFSGTANWGRRAYQFNREATKIHQVQNLTLDRPIAFMSNVDFQDAIQAHWGYGATEICTYQSHGSFFGTTDFILAPHPVDEYVIEITATVNPIIPKIESVRGTDGTTVAGGTSFTSASASFTDKLIGSIIRISCDGNTPTEFNHENYEFQAFVIDVPSATELTLSEPVPTSYTSRGFNVSSPIDIEASTLLEALEDASYEQYCKNHDHKSYPMARQAAAMSLIEARARDNKVSLNSTLWVPYNSDNWWLGGGFYTIARTPS